MEGGNQDKATVWHVLTQALCRAAGGLSKTSVVH
jgi:hypothetical protein